MLPEGDPLVLPAFLASLTWVPSILGLGALVRHDGDPALRPGVAGFLGLGVAGVIGAWLNFWIALGPAVSAIAWLAGAVLFLIHREWLLESWDGRDAVLMILLLAASSWAMRDPRFHYDTGFYHLQALKWITDSSIYPGIANLHYRLGFNSLWSTTAAVLEHPLTSGKSAFFLNQLPILFAGQAALVGLKRLVAGDRTFPNLMLAGAVLPMASATFGIGSLYVDYTTSLVVYLAIALWARAHESGFTHDATPAALLSLLAALLKISAAALPAMGLVLLVARRPVLARRWWLRLGSLSAIAVVPWLARGVLLSGCFVFPAWVTCVNRLPWTVPEAKTRSVAAWVRSWAQKPGPLQDGSWSWLEDWAQRVLRDYPEIPLLLCLGGAGLVLWTIGRRRWSWAVASAFLMALAGAIYWFLAAPEPRFGLGFLFALAVTPMFAGLTATGALLERRAARLVVAATLLVTSAGLVVALDGHPRTGTLYELPPWKRPILEWPKMPLIELELRTTESGLRVLVPAGGTFCFAAPLPCTPDQEFDPALTFEGYFAVPH